MRVRHGRRIRQRRASHVSVLQEEDNVDHIFAQCVYMRQVWYGCLQTVGPQIDEPQATSSLEQWCPAAREQVQKSDMQKFDTLETCENNVVQSS